MSDFRNQISEDIVEYQKRYPHMSNIHKNEWAFNYWVLDKLFFEEEELIESKIIDYSDMGIDAYEFYEETKELYLIQNKYYSDNSSISENYVKNDFLLRPITALENGTYTRSKELQDIFTKYKNNDKFSVHLQIFVTNNCKNTCIDNYIKKFNLSHPKYIAEIFYLQDIENKYFGDIKEVKSTLKVKVDSVNNGTILKINTQGYKLANILDARYVFTPVSSIFRIYRDAVEKNYPIFDMNIREYLGNTGVNKKIYETLLDKEERKNFFYYNNGITLICDKMSSVETKSSSSNINAVFEISNPQIVNGCQTVNSIFQALKNVEPSKLETEFKDAFVMLKILEINRNNDEEEVLYRNIVKYNNSQNSIDEKTFVSNTSEFNRLKIEFENKGLLLLIKQSDKNSYKMKYTTTTKLKERSDMRIKKFGFDDNTFKKTQDYFVPLEKLLQVIIAFVSGGHSAYTKKANLLKYNTEQYQKAIEFIKDPDVTIDALIDLYLLYKKAEERKSGTNENRFPVPYYLIDGFALFECNDRSPNKISEELNNSVQIDKILKLYTMTTHAYTQSIKQDNDIEYNQMIKKPVDYLLMKKQRDIMFSII